MSLRLMVAVQDLPTELVSGWDRVVLIALADHADASGRAWPKQSTIAARWGCSERQVKRSVRALRDAGLVEVRRADRWQPSNHYLLTLPDVEVDPVVPAATDSDDDELRNLTESGSAQRGRGGPSGPSRGDKEAPQRGQGGPSEGTRRPPYKENPHRTLIEPCDDVTVETSSTVVAAHRERAQRGELLAEWEARKSARVLVDEVAR